MPLRVTPGGSPVVNGCVAYKTPEDFTAHPEMHPLKHIPSLITHLCNQEPTASAPAIAQPLASGGVDCLAVAMVVVNAGNSGSCWQWQ